ncbi:hypothetical protein VTK26DRAFT_6489 [Humicola hyalothermophila]
MGRSGRGNPQLWRGAGDGASDELAKRPESLEFCQSSEWPETATKIRRLHSINGPIRPGVEGLGGCCLLTLHRARQTRNCWQLTAPSSASPVVSEHGQEWDWLWLGLRLSGPSAGLAAQSSRSLISVLPAVCRSETGGDTLSDEFNSCELATADDLLECSSQSSRVIMSQTRPPFINGNRDYSTGFSGQRRFGLMDGLEMSCQVPDRGEVRIQDLLCLQ